MHPLMIFGWVRVRRRQSAASGLRSRGGCVAAAESGLPAPPDPAPPPAAPPPKSPPDELPHVDDADRLRRITWWSQNRGADWGYVP